MHRLGRQSVLLTLASLILAGAVSSALTLTSAPADASQDKTTICHKAGALNPKTLQVPAQAVQAHLNHGDTLGPCTQPTPTPAPSPSPTPVPPPPETSIAGSLTPPAPEGGGPAPAPPPPIPSPTDAH